MTNPETNLVCESVCVCEESLEPHKGSVQPFTVDTPDEAEKLIAKFEGSIRVLNNEELRDIAIRHFEDRSIDDFPQKFADAIAKLQANHTTELEWDTVGASERIARLEKYPGGNYSAFAETEIEYYIKSGEVSKATIDHVYPVVEQMFISMDVEGHSGSTYSSHIGVFKRMLNLAEKAVLDRQLPFSNSSAISWKELEAFELEAIGCPIEDYAFNIAIKAKEHREFTFEHLQVIRKIISNVLNFKPITPLTLDKDEWNNVSEYDGPDRKEETFQNRRCSSVFKLITKEDGSEIIYNLDDGLKYNDSNPESDLWFTRGGRKYIIPLDLNKPLGSQRYAIFMKWPNDQEPGTTPDDNWETYNYIPELPTVPPVGTILRRYDFKSFKVLENILDSDGKLKEIVVEDNRNLKSNISADTYLEVGSIFEFKYPRYSVYNPRWWETEVPVEVDEDA